MNENKDKNTKKDIIVKKSGSNKLLNALRFKENDD